MILERDAVLGTEGVDVGPSSVKISCRDKGLLVVRGAAAGVSAGAFSSSGRKVLGVFGRSSFSILGRVPGSFADSMRRLGSGVTAGGLTAFSSTKGLNLHSHTFGILCIKKEEVHTFGVAAGTLFSLRLAF